MNHYYTNDSSLPSNQRLIHFYFQGNEESFVSDDGVFSKDALDYGSRVLLESMMPRDLQGKLLDIGCGIGPIGILLKKNHPQLDVTMIDINERAVTLAALNSKNHQQENRVLVSDGFQNLEGDTFDIIVSNPPIRTGKKNIYRLFEQAYNHLNPNGQIYLVIRKQQGAESAVRYLQGFQSSRVQIINKEGGYWIILLSKDVDILTKR